MYETKNVVIGLISGLVVWIKNTAAFIYIFLFSGLSPQQSASFINWQELVSSVVLAVATAIIGTAVSFFVGRYLKKRYPEKAKPKL